MSSLDICVSIPFCKNCSLLPHPPYSFSSPPALSLSIYSHHRKIHYPLPFNNKTLFGLKRSRRDGSLIVKNVERDSEFEIERDKAREALRKLDDQLQSLSSKKVAPPKIRAVELKQASWREREETWEISGSFLSSAASILVLFTIFYNILFLTVIKPAIDGADTVESADIMKEAQPPQQQLLN